MSERSPAPAPRPDSEGTKRPSARQKLLAVVREIRPQRSFSDAASFMRAANTAAEDTSEREQLPFFQLYRALQRAEGEKNMEDREALLFLADLIITAYSNKEDRQTMAELIQDLDLSGMLEVAKKRMESEVRVQKDRTPTGRVDTSFLSSQEGHETNDIGRSPTASTKRVVRSDVTDVITGPVNSERPPDRPILADITKDALKQTIISLRMMDHIASGKEEMITILENAEGLLNTIMDRAKEIPDQRVSKAIHTAREINEAMRAMSDRAMKDKRYNRVTIPISLRKKLSVLKSISEKITIVTTEDVTQVMINGTLNHPGDRELLVQLLSIFSEAKKKNGKEGQNANINAEELVGMMLLTSPGKKTEAESYFELGEYLIISTAGALINISLDEKNLQSLMAEAVTESGNLTPQDGEKIQQINECLRKLEMEEEAQRKLRESGARGVTNVHENYNINRAYTFANGLIARLVLTVPSQKPNSELEKNFKRFLNYIGSAFRSMHFIPLAEEVRDASGTLSTTGATETVEERQINDRTTREDQVAVMAGGVDMSDWDEMIGAN